jgi:hypothetical protein
MEAPIVIHGGSEVVVGETIQGILEAANAFRFISFILAILDPTIPSIPFKGLPFWGSSGSRVIRLPNQKSKLIGAYGSSRSS